jgi:hypothetical protein
MSASNPIAAYSEDVLAGGADVAPANTKSVV